MSEGVGLNLNVAYQPNNRVMNVLRAQTVSHPPANGSIFSETDDFLHFRIMNTPNTFIDPTKTRLNFKRRMTYIDGLGQGSTAAASAYRDAQGNDSATVGNYGCTLSNAGIAGFFNRIEVRVGGSTVEDLRGYHQVSKFFQSLQVDKSIQHGLLSLTEGFDDDGAGINAQVPVSVPDRSGGLGGYNPAHDTFAGLWGANFPAFGDTMTTLHKNSAVGTNWVTPGNSPYFDGSLPILSNLFGAGATKFFPLCMLRSALEIFIHIEPDVKRTIRSVGENKALVTNSINRGYNTCSWEISSVNLDLGLITFNEDTMDLIRTQVPEDMKIQWTGEQMTCIPTSHSLSITDQEFIVPGCNYRNLKSLFMLQQNKTANSLVDWFDYEGYAICNQQYNIDGRQYPKSVIGQNEQPTAVIANLSALKSSRADFLRHLQSAVNQTTMNLSSGLYTGTIMPYTSARHESQFCGAGYNPLAGIMLDPAVNVIKNEAINGQQGNWVYAWTTTSNQARTQAQSQFATGISFVDIMEYGNNIRVGKGVDTSRAIISTRVRRSQLPSTMGDALYTFIPYFGVEYILDLNSGVLTRDV